jgi:hypothetical protein
MQVQVNVNQQPAAVPAVGTAVDADAAAVADAGPGATAPSEAATAPGPMLEGDEPRVQNLAYSAPDESATGGGLSPALAAGEPGTAPPKQEAVNTPEVRSDWDKTPRNAPCPCGSGKKFKLCHGK